MARIIISSYTKGSGGMLLSVSPDDSMGEQLAKELGEELPKKIRTVALDIFASRLMARKHHTIPVPFTFEGDKRSVASNMKKNIEKIAEQENFNVQVIISQYL